MYGITCLPQGMYLSATDPFWPATHEIRVNYSIWLGAIFLFVTVQGCFAGRIAREARLSNKERMMLSDTRSTSLTMLCACLLPFF